LLQKASHVLVRGFQTRLDIRKMGVILNFYDHLINKGFFNWYIPYLIIVLIVFVIGWRFRSKRARRLKELQKLLVEISKKDES